MLLGIFITLVIGLVLGIPAVYAMKQDRRLTWAGAIGLGSTLFAATMLLVGDVPSRILYWFDARNGEWAKRGGIWKALFSGTLCKASTCPDRYIVIADIVANTVQAILFIGICVAIYMWGQKHRKAGKFKS